VSAAVAKLEETPMPGRLEPPTRQLFERISEQLPLAQRALLRNLWLTGPIVKRRLEANPTTNAMLRTTTAVTIFQAGTKDNVMATTARAVVNFRILPGDSIAAVVAHVRRAIADDRIETKIVGRFSAEPSGVSSADSDGFRILERTIRSVAPDVIVAPYLVVVVTDARHYTGLSDQVFRFLPIRLAASDIGRMHGIDERIAIGEYEGAIRIYRQLVLNVAGQRSKLGIPGAP
jgi:carboxypeptidase PM20D1